MYLDCLETVKDLTKELVRIPSIVKTSGESDVARWIYNYYLGLEYFKQYPEQVVLQETINDEIERHNAIAMVRGTKGDSNRTIVLMGHLDTVGVDDFGVNREAAFDPDKLPEVLKSLNVSEEVMKDIESGEYMFGRGALDMKGGVAGHMYMIEYFSKHPEELNGNVIAIAECDEEDNSHGIISALKVLLKWKEQYGLEYVAAINADYSTPYHPLDNNQYVYFGTIGKLLPSFYVTGKETHVGNSFGGFNPNSLIAEINRKIDLNSELCDEAQGEVTVPPTSLKQTDTKVGYTVQTPLAAYSYYNFFTHSMSPKEVIEKVKGKAEEAFDDLLEYMDGEYRKYCEMGKHTYTPLPYRKRVYTWEEFYNELVTIHGDKFRHYLHNFAADLNKTNPSMDLRDFSVAVIQEAWKWSVDKSPVVIIYYSSLFSSRIEMRGKTEMEKALLDAVKDSIALVQEHSEKPIVVKMFYPYISDSSFMALSDDPDELVALEKNMPSWGTKYNHPIEDILKINVPVVNIGTFGKDGHSLTERVHIKYTFENVPNMTYNTIRTILG
ncbi:M20/M25/M40 family metallo-hydrolase [Gudongella oleilytica]|uniref:M20/M25/M40 family metallo-hydrolase n=1 Tax=Gudongella oleilytica TaxID=1582259 RepID=UPI000FF8837F|nr:M20/M25/M40 family metallo-hydrolase [Gudongella oleilytica]